MASALDYRSSRCAGDLLEGHSGIQEIINIQLLLSIELSSVWCRS